MRLGHFEILVSTPLVSKRFYCDILGFSVTVEQEGGFIWLEKDGVEILLRPGTPPFPANSYETSSGGIVFYSDHLEDELDLLQSRGLVIRGTVDTDRCFTFTDPDGNWFQIVEPEDH